MTTYHLNHTAEDAAKGEQVAALMGHDLTDTPEVLRMVKALGPENPASIALSAAWTHRNPGLFMSPAGVVVPAENGSTFRTLTAEERAEVEAREAAYGEGCDA